MTATAHNPPTLDDLEVLARAEFKALPDELARHVTDVVIRIADFPDPEIEREMGLQSPFDLLGLYQGVSLDRKSVTATPEDMKSVWNRTAPTRKPMLAS